MMADAHVELWIFAYGSLMWRPDFDFTERQRGVIDGYRRALCIWSHVYRGTPEQPGLVFGLATGKTCDGVAYRIPPDAAERTLEQVRLRELVLGVYRETKLPVRLEDGRMISATAYAADPAHPQYAGSVSREEVLSIVRTSRGGAGSNLDYVRNTHAHLVEIGVQDPDLDRLCAALDLAEAG